MATQWRGANISFGDVNQALSSAGRTVAQAGDLAGGFLDRIEKNEKRKADLLQQKIINDRLARAEGRVIADRQAEADLAKALQGINTTKTTSGATTNNQADIDAAVASNAKVNEAVQRRAGRITTSEDQEEAALDSLFEAYTREGEDSGITVDTSVKRRGGYTPTSVTSYTPPKELERALKAQRAVEIMEASPVPQAKSIPVFKSTKGKDKVEPRSKLEYMDEVKKAIYSSGVPASVAAAQLRAQQSYADTMFGSNKKEATFAQQFKVATKLEKDANDHKVGEALAKAHNIKYDNNLTGTALFNFIKNHPKFKTKDSTGKAQSSALTNAAMQELGIDSDHRDDILGLLKDYNINDKSLARELQTINNDYTLLPKLSSTVKDDLAKYIKDNYEKRNKTSN